MFLAEEGDQEPEAGNQEKDTAEHRSEAADAGDDEADCRNDEQDPAEQVDGVVGHVNHKKQENWERASNLGRRRGR